MHVNAGRSCTDWQHRVRQRLSCALEVWAPVHPSSAGFKTCCVSGAVANKGFRCNRVVDTDIVYLMYSVAGCGGENVAHARVVLNELLHISVPAGSRANKLQGALSPAALRY